MVAKALQAATLHQATGRCFWGATEFTKTGAVNRWICLCPGKPSECAWRPPMGRSEVIS